MEEYDKVYLNVVKEDAARSLHPLSFLSTIPLLKTVDNCGKIIDKKWRKNLVI